MEKCDVFLVRQIAVGRGKMWCPLLIMAFLSACAAPRTDLSEAHAVDVKVIPTSQTSIRYISVDATPQETVISGHVKRLGVYNNAFLGARVCAEAVYPDGSKRLEVDDLLERMPRFRNFRMIYPDAKFHFVFPEQLPRGTTLYLKFAAPGAAQGACLPETRS